MTTEELNSENNKLNPGKETVSTENQSAADSEKEFSQTENTDPQANMHTQVSIQIPDEKVLSEVENPDGAEVEISAEPQKTESVQTEASTEKPTLETEIDDTENPQANSETEEAVKIPEEKVLSEINRDSAADHEDEKHNDLRAEAEHLSLDDLISKMQEINNNENAGSYYKEFNVYREFATKHIQEETLAQKNAHTESGQTEESFNFIHPSLSALSGMVTIFKVKQDQYHKEQEIQQKKNIEERHQIVERLKKLNSSAEPGTNLFKEIREIKKAWTEAGQVPKAEFKILNNDYYHHLSQFYQMLDMNKEYLQQEYAHNLEKRQHIIERAKELENEPSVQKALNELQFLHKAWKEEAEPVAEEFREKTWEEFREISNKIHDRRGELNAQLEAEQNENLAKKNQIIEELKSIFATVEKPNHAYWQNAIKKVESLRNDFLKIGSVPRKISNENWTLFKQTLKEFNSAKNDFYKNLKGDQQSNFDKKMALIKTAQDNMNSEDWDTMVPLYKKLQEEWKTIGHVPRAVTNKVWDEFREACNVFFNSYRTKNAAAGDNWKENYKLKRNLIEELQKIQQEEGSAEKLEQLKTAFYAVGKVPRDKMNVNSEFNRLLREKQKLNNIEVEERHSDHGGSAQTTDRARKIKNQIGDLETEIATLENNLGFFSNSSRENPLLKDTYNKIDEKKAQLESMKSELHQLLAKE